MTLDPAARLMAPYRAVRRVSAGDAAPNGAPPQTPGLLTRAPWSGLLVQLPSGESRVLVDAQDFEPDWAGWLAPQDGHVVVPLDLIRRIDGHDVMLPLCVERVDDFLLRRATRRIPLSVGETVTLGVSLVRGFAAWHAIGRGTGEWWLTDGGRPVLACGSSGLEVPRHTAELLRSLAEASPCASALTFAAEAVSGSRVSVHDLREAEDALFGIASAEPLATALLGPRSARDLTGFGRDDPAGRAGIALDDEPGRPTWVDTMARHVDADLADTVSRVTTGVWRRLRTPRAGTRRPWLFAGAAAAAVLAVGLLWPAGAGGPATADDVVQGEVESTGAIAGQGAVSETLPPDPAATGQKVDDPRHPVDLAQVADGLLTARLTCAGDASCLSDVTVDPGAIIPAGAVDLPAAERETSLLDDFGGVAVLRVDSLAGTTESQLVVIMLHDDRWLLRDVHVAKQP